MSLPEFLLARYFEVEAHIMVHRVDAENCQECGVMSVHEGSPLTPARALGDVAAKRAIVAEHSADRSDPDHCAAHDGRYRIQDCPTLQALAAPYADHPDYRPEWRP